MLKIKFEYKDEYSRGKWNEQECIVSSVEECKKNLRFRCRLWIQNYFCWGGLRMKERILDRSDTIVGFAARAKGTNKWLRNNGQVVQTGTNVQTLTKITKSDDWSKTQTLRCLL